MYGEIRLVVCITEAHIHFRPYSIDTVVREDMAEHQSTEVPKRFFNFSSPSLHTTAITTTVCGC